MYSKTIMVKNGKSLSPVDYYKCDITGKEFCEMDGWYGNKNIHITEDGIHILIEQYISRKLGSGLVPLFIKYLELRFSNKIKKDRYIPLKIKKQVLEKYHHQCAYCGSKVNLQIDHIHPVSKGGLGEFKNLQVLCKSCNIKKSNKICQTAI